jgi:hypothetical protein
MIGNHQRNGALEAVERIVNRGDENVVGEVLAVLERLYPTVFLHDDSTIVAPGSTEADAVFLERVRILISAHVPSDENA